MELVAVLFTLLGSLCGMLKVNLRRRIDACTLIHYLPV